jgi:N utilization substance protein B
MNRKASRAIVIQSLYAWAFNEKNTKELIQEIESLHDITGINDFIIDSITKCIDNIEEIDAMITKHSLNWDFERLAPVDLAIIRAAISEILFFEDIPPEVSINEYIEISKKFTSDRGPKFINGILDGILKTLIQSSRLKKTEKGALKHEEKK